MRAVVQEIKSFIVGICGNVCVELNILEFTFKGQVSSM